MTDRSRKSRGSTKGSGKKRSGKQGATNKSSNSRRGGKKRGKRTRSSRSTPDMPPATDEMRQRLSRKLDEGNYIVFDIETTGGNPDKNGITEIFAIKYIDGKPGDTFYSLVNPKIPIPPIVRRMTGINNKMVKDAPIIDEVIPGFMEFAGDDIFVSHNTIGDMKFIRYFAEKVTKKNPENFFLCTHLLVEKLVPEAPDKSLGGLAKFFAIDTGEMHRAEADTYMTLELFKILLEKLKEKSVKIIEEAIRLQGDLESGMRLGWGVPEDRLAGIPSGPGIFYLQDHDKNMLFFSSATHLEREVRKISQFVQLPRQLLRQALKAYDVKVNRTPNIYEAMLMEAEALSKHDLRVKPDSWHQRVYQCLCLAREKDGTLRVTLGSVQEGAIRVYGPVKDRKALGQLLDRAGKIFETGFSRKGMIIPAALEPAFIAWLDGVLGDQVAALNKQRRSLKLLFSRKKRLALTDRVEVKEKLLKLPLPSDLQDLTDLSGMLAVPGKRGECKVYAVTQGKPSAPQVRQVGLEKLREDMDLRKEVAAEIQKAGGELKPLSPLEAQQVNVTLWWVHATRQDGFFIPVDELVTP